MSRNLEELGHLGYMKTNARTCAALKKMMVEEENKAEAYFRKGFYLTEKNKRLGAIHVSRATTLMVAIDLLHNHGLDAIDMDKSP